jgi:hypothetical protein
MDKTEEKDRRAFERAADALRADVTVMAAMVTHDGNIRATYSRKIAQITTSLRQEARAGRMTWAEAATEAQQLRNGTMNILRHRSSPIGRSIAEQLKRTGRTLNELVAKYTIEFYGSGANFAILSTAQQDAVYGMIVERAGQPRQTVSTLAKHASRLGGSLLMLSLAVSVYNVATAEDRLQSAGREAATLGAGVGAGSQAACLLALPAAQARPYA